jgi:hypothetical protein
VSSGDRPNGAVAELSDAAPQERRGRIRVAAAGFGLLAAVVLAGAAIEGPALYLNLGDESYSLDLAQELFGDDVPVPRDDKHDGEWFWNIARDPLLLDPNALEERLDRPVYRSQRILYPLLASPFRLISESALLWGLVLVNLVAIGLGSWIAVLHTELLRAPPRAVVGYIANPAIFLAPFLDVSDALAVTAVLAALHAARRGRTGWVVAASVVAVLSKEPMLAGLVGLAVLAPGIRRADRVAAVVPGAAAGALWGLVVRSRFDRADPEVQEFQIVPYKGIVDTWAERWSATGAISNLVAAVVLAILAAAVIVLFVRWRTAELAMALPFAAMVPFFTPQVLDIPINSYRGVGPMLTLLVWAAYAGTRERGGARSQGIAQAPTGV